MKKFFKNSKIYIFLAILIPVVIAGIFLFDYYRIYKDIKNPLGDSAISSKQVKTAKNPFEGIGEYVENYDNGIKDEGIDVDISKDGKENVETEKNSAVVDTKINTTHTSNIPSSNTSLKNKSYSSIVAYYKIEFEKLQEKQESSLYSLMEEGKTEYLVAKEKKSSITNLASKYLKTVNSMEKQADKEFDSLLSNLKADLNTNSHSTDIVKEIRDYYNYCKKILRVQLIKKATQYL